MSKHSRVAVVVCVVVLAAASWAHAQTAPATAVTDQQVYEAWRAWITKQPPGDRANVIEGYKQVLATQGVAATEIDRRLRVIVEQGKKLEIELWNRILTSDSPTFNTKPNEFLVRMTAGRKPGAALDVGMGQGRNAIYLAQQGWNVTGFDPAEKAVAAAQAEANKLGVSLRTVIAEDDTFDFGRDQWDLVVLSYVTVRHLVARVQQSLKPGGVVVVEAFHRDATKDSGIGGGVVYDTNELLKLFNDFRIVHYEDVRAVGDFGMRDTRVVRLAAEKR
ncbi:MAG TPA: methyltransferase domain-containing protein [Vicinamibacterales bacterium]|nr:methyltransferase domain-containing protein [Vicinamibacterales bacterium]